MTVMAPPDAPRRAGFADSGGLPEAVAGWSLTRIGAGLWLSATGRTVPTDVLGLTAEPGRLALVIDAPGPDVRTDALLGQLLPLLSQAGQSIRLVLAAGADRYANLPHAYGLELLAAEAGVTVTPHGYAVVRSAGLAAQRWLPQWRRCLPSGDQQPAGVLAPSPAWEQHLTSGLAALPGQRLAVRRVQAGLALGDEEPSSPSTQPAGSVWPDPDRVTIVISGAADRDAVLGGLAELLPLLPLRETDGVRLHWPRAAAGDAGAALAQLAARCGSDLIAPVADVSVSGYGGVCHGPMGAAPWLRFTSHGKVEVLGSLYPQPGWEDALASADFAGLGVDQVAAGLCVGRPGPAARGLTATARSIIPAPSGPTIVVGGDAGDGDVRRDVESALGRIPPGSVPRLRILLTGAGAGGHDSYAQFLADRFGFVVAAPRGRWTASPDGMVRALPAPGPAGSGGAADAWQSFSPRNNPPQHAPTTPAGAAATPPPTQVPSVPVPGTPVPAVPSAPVPAVPVPAVPVPSAPVPSVPVPAVPVPSVPVPSVPVPAVPSAPVPAVPVPAVPVPAVPGPSAPGPSVPVPSVPVPAVPGPSAPVRSVPDRGASVLGASAAEAPPRAPLASANPAGTPGDLSFSSNKSQTERIRADGAVPHPAVPELKPQPAAMPEPPVAPPPAPPPGSGPVRLVARDHRSSAQERLGYRESAARYQSYLVAVRRVLTQRPGLRSAASAEGEDAVVTDFAAVLDLLTEDQRNVADALRTPGAGLDPRVPCAVSGLRRLPSFTGAVFSSASLPPATIGDYVPGMTLAEPAFVYASSSGRVQLEGNVEYVIWSQTGKRAAALAPDFGSDEIVFAAGSPYKVLTADVARSGPARVFLRELPGTPEAAGRPGTLDEMDNRALERLMTAVAQRDHVAAGDRVPARLAGRTGQPIGLDSRGNPFR